MFLGKSFELLSTADVAVFAPGWNDARGCIMEHLACEIMALPFGNSKMSKRKLTQYVTALGNMLRKRDWRLIEPFMEEWKTVFKVDVIRDFKKASDNVKKLTYVKMVYGRIDMDLATIQYAMQLQQEVEEEKCKNLSK